MWTFVRSSRWRSAYMIWRLKKMRMGWCPPQNTNHDQGRNRLRLQFLSPALAFVWPLKSFLLSPEERSQLTTVQLFTDAKTAIQSGDFLKADQVLHTLLHHLQLSYSQGFLDANQFADRRVRVYSEMASVHLMNGKLTQAERLLREIIRDSHNQLHVPLDDPMVLELSLKLALIYQRQGRQEEASLGFDYCLDVLNRKLAGEMEDLEAMTNLKALLGMCHNYYSKFLYENGSLEFALEHARSALNLATQLYPASHSNCLNLKSDIAVILIGLERYPEARPYLEDAVAVCETGGEELTDCLAHVLLQLITLEMLDGQVEKAKTLIQKIESLLDKIGSSNEIRKQFDSVKDQYKLNL